MQDHVTVDLQSDDAKLGDRYVLCSDGLSGMITDDEILRVVETTADLTDACRQLVAMANEHGGEDNITCVIVRIEQDPAAPERIDVPDTAQRAPGIAVGEAQAAAPEPGSAAVETADTPPAGVAAVRSPPSDGNATSKGG